MVSLFPGELRRIQRDFWSRQTDVCVIHRATTTYTEQGGALDEYEAVEVTRCRRTPRLFTAREGPRVGVIASEGEWLIALPAGTVIERTDYLVIGDNIYEVRGEFDPTDELQLLIIADEVL